MRQQIRAISQQPVMRKLLWFFDSIWFPLAYALLAFISSLTGLEVAYFGITAIVAVFTCIFSRDSKPMLTLVFMAVYGVSWVHTPQHPYNSDFFNDRWFQIYLLVLGVLVVAAVVFRFVVFPQDRNFFKESKLRLGIILMTAAFLLNGVFFSDYTIANLPFGLLMALSFFLFYVFFYNTMYIDKNTGLHVGYILVIASGLIFLQLAKVLLFDDVIVDGSIDKNLIVAGWGMSNNFGGMLGMLSPACFYVAYKQKRFGWIYYVLGFVFFGGVCLTLSRTSALISGIILVAAAIYLSIAKSPMRKFVRIFNIAVVVAGFVMLIVLWDFVRDLLAVFFERGFDDSGRTFIWQSGITNFLRAPFFGVGFYEPIAPDWSYDVDNWVFPDMYHNIFIQMLASCGIFGLLAYCIHLLQVVFAVKRRPTAESLFYIIILVAVFGMSLLDNHIFHVFPAMVYSVFLLLSEREGEDGPLLLLRPLLIRRKNREGQAAPTPEGAASTTCTEMASAEDNKVSDVRKASVCPGAEEKK